MAGVIAISGGASGIGAAIADACAAAGFAPAIGDLSPPPGGVRVDVTDEAAVEAWIAALGPLAGCVASAGIGTDRHVLETDAAEFRRILEVNLVGSFLVARAAARAMRAQRLGGSIVLIASVSGLRGAKGRSAYGASKAGVINLAQSMAIDLAPDGIRVNAVCPGPVDTPLTRRVHDAATRGQWTRQIPLARYGRTEEIAQAALFLLDPARSSYVTGHALAVDGGYAGAGLMPPGG